MFNPLDPRLKPHAKHCSLAMMSNLFTMGVASASDPRQTIPSGYQIPPVEVRVLRARLIMEEALETCAALGILIKPRSAGVIEPTSEDNYIGKGDLVFSPSNIPASKLDLAEIIDGCCDTIYVCLGTLAACGAPDRPHMMAVCRANDSKFPLGVGITDEHGKYQKPLGWTPPDHDEIIANNNFNLAETSAVVIETSKDLMTEGPRTPIEYKEGN